jgi:cytidine deaminase
VSDSSTTTVATLSAEDQELVNAARSARIRAYAPYSKFNAGAAVRCEDGQAVTGVLVENISLGLSMCAERVALFAAVDAASRPTTLVLAAPQTADGLTEPCGACLQVALELGGPSLRVIAVGVDDTTRLSTVGELLGRGPHSGLKGFRT